MYMWNELKLSDEKKKLNNKMVGGYDFKNYNSRIGNKGGSYIVPLNFGFVMILVKVFLW